MGVDALARYTIRTMKLLRVAVLSLAIGLPVLCFAQWQWVDKDGRKVFSDRPPPSDIPAKDILKQPGPRGKSVNVAEPAVAAASEPAKPAASVPKVSGKDRELEEKKKQADAAEAEKKRAQDEKYAKDKSDICARVKQSKAGYDSGIRMARVNAKGEQEYLDDAGRTAELKRLQSIIDNDCK